MNDPTELDAAGLGRAYASGCLDPVAVTEAYLERISALDDRLRAFILVSSERARADAEASRRRWRDGRPLGPLDGVPIALKDNIDVAGLPCTAGTAAFARRIAPADAACFARLRTAGAVLLGKLNMHEAALGATTDNPVYGRCIHPLRAGHTPGGSSGGSGAAVAGRLALVALGTDTLGSVRVPASYCGVHGLKPTTGAVPTTGVVPLSPSLDCVGPLARSGADLRALATVLLGRPAAAAPVAARGLVVGRPAELAEVALVGEVAVAYEAFLGALSRAGARIVEVGIAPWRPSVARRAGLLVSEAEGAAFWEAALGPSLPGLSPELTAMLRFPSTAGPRRLSAAREVLRTVGAACRRVLLEVDLIALPTTPHTSFPHGGPVPIDQADLTALASLAGVPALSVPFGTGLPAPGMQLLAARGRDDLLLGLGDALEGLAPAA